MWRYVTKISDRRVCGYWFAISWSKYSAANYSRTMQSRRWGITTPAGVGNGSSARASSYNGVCERRFSPSPSPFFSFLFVSSVLIGVIVGIGDEKSKNHAPRAYIRDTTCIIMYIYIVTYYKIIAHSSFGPTKRI